MEEKEFTEELQVLQDELLDLLNSSEIDVSECSLVIEKFVKLANQIADQLSELVRLKLSPSQRFQDDVIHLAHLNNIVDMIRQKLKSLKIIG